MYIFTRVFTKHFHWLFVVTIPSKLFYMKG